MGKFRSGKVIPDVPRLPGFMTSAEAAILLNVTPPRITQMVKAGQLGQPFRIGPHIVLQSQCVQEVYQKRLADPRYKTLLRDRIFPTEFLPTEVPDLDDSLKQVADAYLAQDTA